MSRHHQFHLVSPGLTWPHLVAPVAAAAARLTATRASHHLLLHHVQAVPLWTLQIAFFNIHYLVSGINFLINVFSLTKLCFPHFHFFSNMFIVINITLVLPSCSHFLLFQAKTYLFHKSYLSQIFSHSLDYGTSKTSWVLITTINEFISLNNFYASPIAQLPGGLMFHRACFFDHQTFNLPARAAASPQIISEVAG